MSDGEYTEYDTEAGLDELAGLAEAQRVRDDEMIELIRKILANGGTWEEIGETILRGYQR